MPNPYTEMSSIEAMEMILKEQREYQSGWLDFDKVLEEHFKNMKPYVRKPEITKALTEQLCKALIARPNERLGQLLINLDPNEDKGSLWNVYDETWLELLTESNNAE